MVNIALAKDYLQRARIRLEMLDTLTERKDYADVIRFSQEIVELCEKAILIKLGITPPKLHEVINVIIENIDKIPERHRKFFLNIKRDCKWLRSQRELAFYGAMDFIPLEDYTSAEAKKAKRIAEKFLKHADSLIEEDLSKGGLNL